MNSSPGLLGLKKIILARNRPLNQQGNRQWRQQLKWNLIVPSIVNFSINFASQEGIEYLKNSRQDTLLEMQGLTAPRSTTAADDDESEETDSDSSGDVANGTAKLAKNTTMVATAEVRHCSNKFCYSQKRCCRIRKRLEWWKLWEALQIKMPKHEVSRSSWRSSCATLLQLLTIMTLSRKWRGLAGRTPWLKRLKWSEQSDQRFCPLITFAFLSLQEAAQLIGDEQLGDSRSSTHAAKKAENEEVSPTPVKTRSMTETLKESETDRQNAQL